MAVGLLLSLCPAGADQVAERYFFRDATAALTLDRLPQDRFLRFEGVLAAGYGTDVVWLRLKLNPERREGRDKLVVRIRPPILDHVTVHGPTGTSYVTGDFRPSTADAYRSTNLNARVEAPPGSDIFVAVRSQTARPVFVDALTIEDAAAKDAAQTSLVSAYSLLVLLSAVLAFVHFIRNAERMIGWFVVRQISELAYVTLNLGLVRYLLPEAPEGLVSAATNVINLVYVGISIYFAYVLISEYRPLRVARIAFGGVLLIWGGAVGLYLWGDVMEALRLNVLAGLAVLIVLIPAAASTRPSEGRRTPVLPKPAMVAMFVLISILGTIAVMVQLGVFKDIVHHPEGTLYALFFHGLVTTLCMSAFMYARSMRLAAEHENSERLLLLTRAQAEQERLSREEQEQLLSMLAHELRTPISVMKMHLGPWLKDNEGVRELRLAAEEMAAVLDKTVQAGQVSGGELTLSLVEFEVGAELNRLQEKFIDPRLRIVPPDIRNVTNDLTLIRIVLNNLVENAIKYGSEKHPIVVSGRIEHERLELWVQNAKSDFGFPDPDTVFRKYVRGPHAHRRSGSGLGLFIVDTVARRLGGAAFCEKRDDVIRFGIRIPADAEPSADPASLR